MADVQRVSVWPASLREIFERKSTPYVLLNERAGVVARAAWWLLQKLGALTPCMESVRRWDYVPHKQKALHEAMLAAMREDLEYIYNGKAVFIMGGATFSELVNAPAFRDVMRFETGPFGMSGDSHDPYGGRRIFDVPIHIVPNMTGMALVPRVIVEGSR